MRDRPRGSPYFLPVIFGLLLVFHLVDTSPAAAHKASVFAAVQGKVIAGEAYFRDGSPLRSAQVTVFDPAGAKLGETKTDAQGRFSFEPRCRCDHRVVVDGGEGHAAQYTVRAEELPSGLPKGGASSPTNVAQTPSAVQNSPAQPGAAVPQDSAGRDADLRGELEASQSQRVQLRGDLAARDDTKRWRDVLGGIGYILGLMGLAFYFLGVRRKAASPPRPPAGG